MSLGLQTTPRSMSPIRKHIQTNRKKLRYANRKFFGQTHIA